MEESRAMRGAPFRRAAVLAAAIVVVLGALSDSAAQVRAKGSGATALAYGGNAARSGRSTEKRVFGPLALDWTHPGSAGPPLITKNRILAAVSNSEQQNYGSRVFALNPRTGRTIWRRKIEGVYYTSTIAASNDTVVSLNLDGRLRAFKTSNGKHLWTSDSPEPVQLTEAPPVIADGTVYTYAGASDSHRFSAYRLSDGARLWSSPRIPITSGAGGPALDATHAYVSDDCGNAAAVNRSNGTVAWRRAGGDCFADTYTSVANGVVYTGHGFRFRASDGAPLGKIEGGTPDALDGHFAFRAAHGFTARNLATGKVRWKHKGGFGLRAVIAGPTVYSAGRRHLTGYGRSGGKLLSRTRTGFVGGPNLAIGQHALAISTGSAVSLYRPVLRPRGRKLAIAASGFDVRAGKKISIGSAVPPQLRRKRQKIGLQFDPHPFKRLRTAIRRPTNEDGTSYFRAKIGRNTKFRVKANHAKASHAITIFAYPKLRLRFSHVRVHSATAKVGASHVPASKLKGRKVVAYFNPARTDRYKRIGSGRLHGGGKRSAHSSFRVGLPANRGGHDKVAICVVGIARAGYGRNIGLQRKCGKRTVRPRRARVSRPLAAARGTGPAGAAGMSAGPRGGHAAPGSVAAAP